MIVTAYTRSESVEIGTHAQINLQGGKRKDLAGIKFIATKVKCKPRATRRSIVGQPKIKKIVKK
jgi:ribosomal protein S12